MRFWLLTLLSYVSVHAASLSDLTWTTAGNQVTITHCKIGATGTMNIPATIGGIPVTAIGNDAFAQCRFLTSVTIPSSVTAIGNTAFYLCSGLTSASIGTGVSSIGDFAFSQCTGLTSLTIPGNVTSIGYSSFSNCTGLSSVTLTDGITTIAQASFDRCTGLSMVTIPDSVTFIGSAAFANCNNLTAIDVSPGNLAFTSSSGALFNLTQTSLHSVPGGYTGAFSIPNSVTSIEEFAFLGCSTLTSVAVPASVTSIGNRALGACGNLTSIVVAEENTEFSSIDGALYNEAGTEILAVPGGFTGAFTVPSSVTSIGHSAFFACTDLTLISVPPTLATIGDWAFYDCNSLTSIALPEGLTSVGYSAFEKCSSLISVTIPASVTSIGEWAFGSCSALTSATILADIDSIGSFTFFYCSSLTSVVIPSTVTSIGDWAFYQCSSLTSIFLPHELTSIGLNAFRYCTALTSINFSGPAPANVGISAFSSIGPGALAEVLPDYAASYGGEGATWNGLLVELLVVPAKPPFITSCGFVDADTFFIEFSPGGTGYIVTTAPTLDFSVATDVTPTVAPSTAGENRFEFDVTGPTGFFRVEMP